MKDIRQDFKVVFVDEDYVQSTEIVESIQEVGYQTQFYPTFDSALVGVTVASPHILLVNYSRDEVAADRFINRVRKMSPETQIILMINEAQTMTSVMKTTAKEIFDYMTLPIISAAEVLLRVDRASEFLYFKFENEQLRKRRGNAEASLGDMNFEENESEKIFTKLQSRFEELDLTQDQDELVKKYVFKSLRFAAVCLLFTYAFCPCS